MAAWIAAAARSREFPRGKAEMLNWFRPAARCPVSDESRAWLDARWAWLETQFGRDRVRRAEVIRATPEFFPDPYDGSPDAAKVLFHRVREYMGLDRPRVRLEFYDERRVGAADPDPETGIVGPDRPAEGHCVVWVETNQLRDPLAMVAQMARELAHIHLSGRERLGQDAADCEPLPDLLTLFLGLGVFTANAVTHFTPSSWSPTDALGMGTYAADSTVLEPAGEEGRAIAWQGHLSMSDFGYAFAKFARSRDEDGRDWERDLRLDVRAAFRQAMRFLAAEADGPFPA